MYPITNTVRVLKCNFSVSAHVRDKVNCGFFGSRAFFLASLKLTKPPINYQSRVPRNPSSTKPPSSYFSCRGNFPIISSSLVLAGRKRGLIKQSGNKSGGQNFGICPAKSYAIKKRFATANCFRAKFVSDPC